MPLVRQIGRLSETPPVEGIRRENQSMKNRNTSYWACQIGGWAVFSLLGLTTGAMESGWRPSAIIGYVLFFSYSIGLTHMLRGVIHREHWMSLPWHRLLPRLAASSVAIGSVQTMLVVGVYTAIEGRMGDWSDRSSIVFLFLGVTVFSTIWSILYLAIATLRRSRETRNAEMQMKLALSNAELRALEAQVNPHFLFNCLNSIRGMIGEDPEQARDMITRLAGILRYSLQRDRRHMAPLSDEIGIVSDYLALEAIRFDDRLKVHVDIEESARKSLVPPMVLQTLVENAIKHGVEERAEGGDVEIHAAVRNGDLRIDVENPGTLNEPKSESTQIGLANARERLRILYGERASLRLAATREGRVAATLQIPAAI